MTPSHRPTVGGGGTWGKGAGPRQDADCGEGRAEGEARADVSCGLQEDPSLPCLHCDNPVPTHRKWKGMAYAQDGLGG